MLGRRSCARACVSGWREQADVTLTFGSLFAGVGGLDLGLERAGLECRWQVEIDPYCRAVLARHWPELPRFGDIREVRGDELEAVDAIVGGFPCQDLSNAGSRVGIEGERSGLWREFIRLVREMGPRFVLMENVSALAVRGLDRILGELASLGFNAEWDCLRASDVGAPHRRERLFVLAYANGAPRGSMERRQRGGRGAEVGSGATSEPRRRGSALADSGSESREARRAAERGQAPAQLPPAVADSGGIDAQRLGDGRGVGGEASSLQGGGNQRQRDRHATRDRRAALADADLDGLPGLGVEVPRREQRTPRSLADRRGGAPAALERANGTRGDERTGPVRRGRAESPDAGRGDVGNVDVSGLEGRGVLGGRRADECLARAPSAPFPPGPTEREGWRAYLERWPRTEPAVRRGTDGLPARLDRRTDRLRALGNAVVPQVAEALGELILARAEGVLP